MATKRVKPKFINLLITSLEESEGSGKWKYEETANFWNLRNSASYHRIFKKVIDPLNYPVELKILLDEVNNISSHSPYLDPKVSVLTLGDSPEFVPCGNNIDKPCHFVISVKHLQDQYLLKNIIEKGRFNLDQLPLFQDFFVKYHAEANRLKERSYSLQDKIKDRLDNLFYQSEKYKNQTVTKSMMDLVKNPLYKFLLKNGKLLQSRVRNKNIIQTIGLFDPEHIFLYKGQVLYSPKIYLSVRDLYRDCMEDLASFQVELCFMNHREQADAFINHYSEQVGDAGIMKLNAPFKILKALERGLEFTIRGHSEDGEEYLERAKEYYKLMVQFVKDI